MKRTLVLSMFAGAILLASQPVLADKHGPSAKPRVGIESCLPAVTAARPGEALQVVLKLEDDGELNWEVEIAGKDGKFYDVECSAETGKVEEIEQRVANAFDPLFKAKVSEYAAAQAALAKFPGRIERVEYEIEPDGKLSYEFDIETRDGDMRVEVDATTGAIVSYSKELLDIGNP